MKGRWSSRFAGLLAGLLFVSVATTFSGCGGEETQTEDSKKETEVQQKNMQDQMQKYMQGQGKAK
jgi:hypothetical protein